MKKQNNNLNIKDFNIIYDNIFVKGISIEEKDGIYRPSQYDDKPELGEVILVGEGRIFDNGTIIPLKVQVGDKIYFNKYSTTKFNIDGEDYYVVREEDVIAYVR